MSTIAVRIVIDRSPTDVWEYVKDISSHVEWMVDAVEISFLSDQQSGVGTSFECATQVGPFKTIDVMTVTSWLPETEMGVRHQGAVTGEGVFRLNPIGPSKTEFSWQETLVFPWWMGAGLGSAVARPVLTAVWRRNLKALKQRVESR